MTHPIMLLTNPKRKKAGRPKSKSGLPRMKKKPRTTPKREAGTGRFLAKKPTAKKRAEPKKKPSVVKAMGRKIVSSRNIQKKVTQRREIMSAPKKNVIRRSTTAKKIVRRTGAKAWGALKGISPKMAVKNSFLLFIGMFAAQFSAKKFGGDYTANLGDASSWSAMSYIKAGIGGVVAGVAANMLRPGTGQRVTEGAFAHLLFQLAQNYGISANEWAQGQFGEIGTRNPLDLPELSITSQGQMFGSYGEDPIPIDDEYRMLGDELVQRDQFGDIQESAGRLGSIAESIAASIRH